MYTRRPLQGRLSLAHYPTLYTRRQGNIQTHQYIRHIKQNNTRLSAITYVLLLLTSFKEYASFMHIFLLLRLANHYIMGQHTTNVS